MENETDDGRLWYEPTFFLAGVCKVCGRPTHKCRCMNYWERFEEKLGVQTAKKEWPVYEGKK